MVSTLALCAVTICSAVIMWRSPGDVGGAGQCSSAIYAALQHRPKYRGKPEHCKHFLLRRTTLVGNPYVAARAPAVGAVAPGGRAHEAFHADQQPLAAAARAHAFPRPSTGACAPWSKPGRSSRFARRSRSSDETWRSPTTPRYVAAIAGNGLSAAEQRAIGFPWSEAMVARARRSVGATLAAARAALVEGVAANLAGGTHHASAGRGSGYCVFNDVAVAARAVQADAAVRRQRRCRASSSSTSTSTRATAPPRSSPATRACSRCRCTARRTSRSARRRATSTSACPTAAATPTISPRSTRRSAAIWREHARATVRPGLLSRRRRPARGRPPRPPEADRGRTARARPARARGAARARASRWRCRWPAAMATTSRSRSRSRRRRSAPRSTSWQGWKQCAGHERQLSRRFQRSLPPSTGRSRCRAPPTAGSSPLATRWIDNDAYGHINNVVYYSLFDTRGQRRS